MYPLSPAKIQFETTTLCNATCGFCPQGANGQPARLMEDSIWKKIIDDTRGLHVTYRPFILNEPFTDRRMGKMLGYINEDPTARIEFNTNASLVTEEVAELLVENRVSVMRFSLDGIDSDSIRRIRGLEKDAVYRGVWNFIRSNQKSSSPARVEVRMIDFPGTEEEQERFRDYWKDEVDLVVFTKLYDYPWTVQTKSIKAPCPKIRDEMFFRWDGRAILCCWDAFGKAIVESVAEKSVLEIWNGCKMKNYREYLDRGEREALDLCRRCDAFKELVIDP
jgi:Radical SAM superfamily/Iron-sulfur cluster-binding domain